MVPVLGRRVVLAQNAFSPFGLLGKVDADVLGTVLGREHVFCGSAALQSVRS